MKRMWRLLSVALVLALLLVAVSPVTLALTRDERRAIMKSCVLILPLQVVDGEIVNIPWSGSGTIIDRKGLILTNYHVVQETGDWNMIGILITTRSDQKPEPTYLAQIVAKDPTADLAVLQIISDWEGNPVDFDTLGLVPVPIGDAEDLELGDDVTIFGYPGIGAGTITLTEGKIAGFLSDETVAYQRGWLKTDASIAGGNSGGTAVDADGILVGIPTRGSMVDVRRIADTNGDGIIDEADSAVPTGGFINLLRPVNLAYDLISQAQNSTVVPGDTVDPLNPGPVNDNTLPKNASFSAFAFASSIDTDRNPVDISDSFGADITTLFAFCDFENMVDGLSMHYIWTIDDQKAFEKTTGWPFGQDGSFYLSLTNGGDPLPSGVYQVELIIAGQTVQLSSATVGDPDADPGQRPSITSKGVTLSGFLYDAFTGNPIVGAKFIILKPGITVASYLRTQRKDSVAAMGESDEEGYYTTTPPLARGQTYGAVILAQGYETLSQNKALALSSDVPDDLEIDQIYMLPQ
ncbi:MAG: S1 family peptidase [Anaerolineae bacterium]